MAQEPTPVNFQKIEYLILVTIILGGDIWFVVQKFGRLGITSIIIIFVHSIEEPQLGRNKSNFFFPLEV